MSGIFFLVKKNFDDGNFYARQIGPLRDHRTKEEKDAIRACIELNEAGEALSLDKLIAAYQKDGLKDFREPEKPKLKPPEEKRDRSWSGQRIGAKHTPEGLAAFYIGMFLKDFANAIPVNENLSA